MDVNAPLAQRLAFLQACPRAAGEDIANTVKKLKKSIACEIFTQRDSKAFR
jgi:hypothetical protein